MNRPATIVAIAISALLLFPASAQPPDSADLTLNGAPSSGGARAEPEYCGTGLHSRWAEYDFSNTFMFTRWSVVMETGKATLMKDITFQNDVWTSRASLPAGQNRSGHVAVYDTTHNIVIVEGGYSLTPGMAQPSYYLPLCTYDPATDDWTEHGLSKLPQSSTGVWNPDAGCLVVCGGSEVVGGNTVVHNETWAWNPSIDTWSRFADMPAPRYGQCSVYDPDHGLMLVFGGKNGQANFNDVWSFDLNSNKWTVLSPVADEFPFVRAFSTAVWNPARKEMLIFGGENPNVTFLSTWAYSYANNTWIHRTSASWALSMHAACYIADRNLMSVFGGRWHPGNQQYEYYNNTWSYDSVSDSFGAAANAPVPGVSRAGAAAVYDTERMRAYVIGGNDAGGFCLNESWAFAPGQMNSNYYTPGHMEPSVLDLGENFSSLDKVSWTADMPAGTAASMRVRASADNSSFGPYMTVASGGRPAQQGRYIRWNMTLAASPDALSAPVISGVRFDYTVNSRPTVSAGESGAAPKNRPVALNGSGSDPDNDALTYRWVKLSQLAGSFDDPSRPGALYTPLEAGEHMLQLVVNDSYCEVASPYITITVGNIAPDADPGPDLSCFKGETVTPGATASDPDGDILSYNWSTSSGGLQFSSFKTLRPSITTSRAGNFTLTLKVDDGEAQSVGRLNLTVYSQAPLARLDASPVSVNLQGRVNFTAARSSDPDGNITRYLFDFGDGNDTGWIARPEASYAYTLPGIYNATVMVQDDDGNLSAAPASARITVANALPVIDASAVPRTGNISTSFRFTLDAASHDPDGRLASVEWDFGDGNYSSGTTVAHSYSRRGNFTVRLTVTDDAGGVSMMNITVQVQDRAPQILSASPATPLDMNVGKPTIFSVSARDPDGDGLNYSWTVDGIPAGQNSETFTYKATKAQTHTLAVTVSDGEQSVTHEWTVDARAEPIVNGAGTPFLLPMVIVVIVLVAAIAVVVAMRRRA